jgi:hypothetical protein
MHNCGGGDGDDEDAPTGIRRCVPLAITNPITTGTRPRRTICCPGASRNRSLSRCEARPNGRRGPGGCGVEWIRDTPTPSGQRQYLKPRISEEKVEGYLNGKLYLAHTLPTLASG